MLDAELSLHHVLRQGLQPGVADVPQLPVDENAQQRLVVHQDQQLVLSQRLVAGLLQSTGYPQELPLHRMVPSVCWRTEA